MAAMKLQTPCFRLLICGGDSRRFRVGLRPPMAAGLGGVANTGNAVQWTGWILATVFVLGSGLVHAQTPVCASLPASPACNPVTSDANFNTAIGTNAMLSLTTGSYNTSGGRGALNSVADGYSNTAFGTLTLNDSVSGYRNTAIGNQSMEYDTSGYE